MIMENMDRADMPPCDKTNCILESDLAVLSLNNKIGELIVMDCPEGFYVIVTLALPYPPLGLYIITRRNPGFPKVFKSLQTANEHLKNNYPTDSITVLRNCSFPPMPVVVPKKKKKKKKKVKTEGQRKRATPKPTKPT